MELSSYIMNDFTSLIESKIKKNFQTHELTVDNRDEEFITNVFLLGSYLKKNGTNVDIAFPVTFLKPVTEKKKELEEAINAILRIKSTFVHRGEGNAKYSYDPTRDVFLFSNDYDDKIHSKFQIETEIPSFLLERFCATSFREYYHILDAKEVPYYLFLKSPEGYIPVEKRRHFFHENHEIFSKLYHIDEAKTIFQFHVTGSIYPDPQRSGYEIQEKIKRIVDHPSILARNEDVRVIGNPRNYGFNIYEYDLITVLQYGDYYLMDVYDNKSAKNNVSFHDTKKGSVIESISSNIQLNGEYSTRENIIQTLLRLEAKNLNGNEHNRYLDFAFFDIVDHTKEYPFLLKNLYNENEQILRSLENGIQRIDTNPSEEGRKVLKESLENNFARYFTKMMDRIEHLNNHVIHHLRNGVSHFFLLNEEEKIAFYDKENDGSAYKFCIEGNVETFQILDHTLNGGSNYGKDNYTLEVFLRNFSKYMIDYYQIIEGEDTYQSSISSASLIETTYQRLNNIFYYLYQRELKKDYYEIEKEEETSKKLIKK